MKTKYGSSCLQPQKSFFMIGLTGIQKYNAVNDIVKFYSHQKFTINFPSCLLQLLLYRLFIVFCPHSQIGVSLWLPRKPCQRILPKQFSKKSNAISFTWFWSKMAVMYHCGLTNDLAVTESSVRWKCQSLTAANFLAAARDINIECSKQFK